MKKVLVATCFLFLTKVGFAQEPSKLVIDEGSQRNNLSIDRKWSDWDTPRPVDLICIIDIKNDKILVVSKKVNAHKIIKYFEEEIDVNGERRMVFDTETNEGSKSRFVLNKLSGNKGTRLYVLNETIEICYNVKKVE